MKYKVFNSYGGFELKNGNIRLQYKDIEHILVKTPNGEEGYVRIVGTNYVHEQGYSANENIYKLITLDYRVLNITNELEIENYDNTTS